MKERVGQKIKLTNYEALLGVSNEESAVDVSIRDIHSFENHPFKVVDDDKMAELVESIKVNGVLTPVLIRPSKKTRGYEMISGHRRLHAAGLAGLSMIPAIVREMDDDTAVLTMVDANIQREELLPSEKAFAYKMKMDAMRRQAGRPTKENSRHFVDNFKTADMVGRDNGESGRQVQRYIRLTELIPELLEYVDTSRISHRGRKRLRYALYEAAISVIGKNKEFKEIHDYYRTRKQNPLKKMQSVIAIACKLIRIFYTLLTKGVDYDSQKMLSDIVRPETIMAA